MTNKLGRILTGKEKRSLLGLSLGSLILSLSETLSIGIVIPIMSLFMDPMRIHKSEALGFIYKITGCADSTSFLALLVFLAVGLFALKSVYSVFMAYAQQDVIGKIYIRLTGEVLRSYLRRPYSFHLANNSSVLFKNINTEVSIFTSYFLTPIVMIVSEAIVLAGIAVFMVLIYPVVTFLMIAFFGVIMLGMHIFFNNRIKAYSNQREKQSEEMYKVALEALHAVKEIMIFNASHIFVDRFTRAVRKYTAAFIKFTTVSVLPRSIIEFTLVSSILLAILACVLLHKTPADLIPMMTAMGVASLRLLPSTSRIYSSITSFSFSGDSMDIVYDIVVESMPHRSSIAADARHSMPHKNTGPIELKDITFKYESSSRPIFEGLSLTIPCNRVIAVVGRTGVGKSTLIDIVMGLLTPSQGALHYQGSPVSQGAIDRYLRNIGYVPQTIFLLDDTIASNIAFGIPFEEIDRRRLEEVIGLAQLDSFVKELPHGLDSRVGERGVRISGGQRQRIGIARALYRDPNILVFDEATSALDAHTEAEVYAAIKNAGKDITIILVTHRVSSLEKSDLIYVMDAGKIVDKGTYRELIERCPAFQQIARQKTHSAIKEEVEGGV